LQTARYRGQRSACNPSRALAHTYRDHDAQGRLKHERLPFEHKIFSVRQERGHSGPQGLNKRLLFRLILFKGFTLVWLDKKFDRLENFSRLHVSLAAKELEEEHLIS
jgi:hypothetical protein